MPEEVIRATEGIREQAERRIKQLDDAIETLVPTRFSNYTDTDPHKEILARKLFHELWHEMDALKIRLSVAKGESRPISGVLRYISKYMGVDPILFNEITFGMEQLEKRIDGKLGAVVKKAYDLYQGASGKSTGGISVSTKASFACQASSSRSRSTSSARELSIFTAASLLQPPRSRGVSGGTPRRLPRAAAPARPWPALRARCPRSRA